MAAVRIFEAMSDKFNLESVPSSLVAAEQRAVFKDKVVKRMLEPYGEKIENE
jgi:hypothetical protein